MLNPSDLSVYIIQAKAALMENNSDKALKMVNHVLLKDPNQLLALNLKAEAYLAKNQPKGALKATKKAQVTHPYNAETFRLQILSKRRIGNLY